MGDNPAEQSFTRRGFLAYVIGRGTTIAAQGVNEIIARKTKRLRSRPPGALDELEFLTACTRCDECVLACPPKVIRFHDVGSGVLYKTPFLDYGQGGCRWCEDFPCIQSCPTDALSRMQDARVAPVAKLTVNPDHCLVNQGQHCDYCRKACPSHLEPAIKLERRKAPEVDLAKCVGCGECVHICVSQTGPVFELEPL